MNVCFIISKLQSRIDYYREGRPDIDQIFLEEYLIQFILYERFCETPDC